MKDGMDKFTELLNRYSKLISSLENDNLLLPFSSNLAQVDEVRNLMNELQQLRLQLIDVIISFRSTLNSISIY